MQKTPLARALVVMLLAAAFAWLTTSWSYSGPAPEAAPVDTGAKPAAATPDLESAHIEADFDDKGTRYQYLAGLGADIDKARKNKDAEALAIAASQLFLAEKLSGKKSSHVSAQALLDEATTLAESQKNGGAAQVVAKVWANADFGPGDAAKAKTLTDKAKVWEAEQASAKRGACRLICRNNTSHEVDIFADNKYLGTLPAFDTRYVWVSSGYTNLYAHAECHDLEWGPTEYRLTDEFTWRLNR